MLALSSPEPSEENYKRTAPWNISAICHRWRAIALVYPRLWVHITTENHVCSLPRATCANALDFRRCFIQLERSGSLGLLIDTRTGVEANEASDSRACPWRKSVLRTVSFQACRWKALKIENNQDEAYYHLWETISIETLEAVQSLEYACRSGPQPAELAGTLYGFVIPRHLPNLRRLQISLWNGRCFLTEGSLLYSLHALTMSDYNAGLGELLIVLSHCQSLKDLHLYLSILSTTMKKALFSPSNCYRWSDFIS
jgi:hypothetical protein